MPTQPVKKRGGHRGRGFAWATFLILVGVCVLGMSRYHIDNSIQRWVPGLAGQQVAKTYIVIGGPTRWLDPATLARKLNALPEVLACFWPDAPISPAVLLRRADGRGARPRPVFDDKGYTGLFCFPREGTDPAVFLRAVRNAIDETTGVHPHGIALGGPAIFSEALDDWSQRGLPAISAFIVLAGGLLLVCVTGRVRASVAASAAIVGGQVILVGLMSWMGVAMDMVLSMVSPLMMSLGYSFAAHRILRSNISGTLAWCAVTTAAGIFGFVFTGFPPIRSFALWGALGLLITWGSVMWLVRHEPVARRTGLFPRRFKRGMIRLAYACAYRHPVPAVATALLFMAASIICLPFVGIEHDPVNYFPAYSRVYRDHIELDRRLIGMLPFEVVVSSARRDSDTVAPPAASAGDVLAGTPGVRLIVEAGFLDGVGTRRYLCFADSDSLADLVAAQSVWHDWAAAHRLSLRWTGVAAQLHAVARGMARVAATAFPVMVVLAGFAVWLISGRGLRVAVIGAAVNLLPIAVLITVMAVAQLPVSLPSLMIGAIAVGIAVDDTLHLTAGLGRGTDHRRVWRRCLRPCAGSSLIVAVCMASFIVAPFRPTAEFGGLMSLGVLSALAADLFVLPGALILTGGITKRPFNGHRPDAP